VLLATAAAFAGDAPADPHAKVRREAVEELRKGAPAGELAGRLRAGADAAGSLLASMDCVAWLAAASRDAVAKRDAQGREMQAYFKAHYMGSSEPSSAERATYEDMESKNRALCADVALRELQIESMHDAARAMASASPSSGPDVPGVVDAMRALIKSARFPAVRARVLDAIDGPFVAALETEIDACAAKGERSERVAALRRLATLGPTVRLDPLRPCLVDQDPYVRRAAFPVFAASGSKEAVDALVMRTASEVGVPARELLGALRRLTGQNLGASAVAWQDWWDTARSAWEGPPAVPAAEPKDVETTTKYFGLLLHSMRVVFVVDCSGSMMFPVSYDGKTTAELLVGDSKMDVAKRELVQAITGLPDGASFNVVAFGTNTNKFAPKLVPATRDARKRAQAWTEKLDVDGATNLSGALTEAFDLLSPGPYAKDAEIADTIVVMTDGIPTCGPIDLVTDLLDDVRRRNRERMVAIHCVYLGNEGDVRFLQQLAKDCGGQFVHFAK